MYNQDPRELIQEVFNEYRKIGKIRCPVLNTDVYFLSEGRVHLIYKSNRKKRPIKEQLYKLSLFKYVPIIIKKANKIQSWRFVGNIQYYAICEKHDSQRIRVIIKRVSNGKFQYHSVMRENQKRP